MSNSLYIPTKFVQKKRTIYFIFIYFSVYPWVPLKTEYRFFQVKQGITHFDSLYHPEATRKNPKKTTSNELKGPTG